MTAAISSLIKTTPAQVPSAIQQSIKPSRDSDGDNDGSSANAVKPAAPALGSVGNKINTTA